MKFETYDEVQEYLNHDEIECLICGEKFKFLGGHIRQAHFISAKEYREIYNLPIHAPLAGLGYRKAHRDVMNELYEVGILKPTKTKEDLKKMSKKGATAKIIHSGITKRVYIMKRKKTDRLQPKLEAAKAAEAMGDPSLMQEYQKDKQKRKKAKTNKFASLGVKSCAEVSVITGYAPRTVRLYAEILGVKQYKEFANKGKYGWTDEEIERFCTEKSNAKKKAAKKQWETKGIIGATGIKGVSLHKPSGKYTAYICVGRKTQYIGLFANIEDAKEARKKAERKYFKPLVDKWKQKTTK